ncbi:MAG TPA: hypothetical protein VFH80_20025, partial [Solirubrobacteraceae bacterium]|nr:hypothetical protein [Solirubrobacteraceae bacterium]
MEARSLPSRTASSVGRTALLEIRRVAGRWGLVALLVAFPVYFLIHDLTTGYPGFVNGHATRVHDFTYLGTNIVQGISNGAIWALIAIGYTLVYGIIELINFAHGDVFMLGSFTAVGMWAVFGLSPGMGAAALIGYLLLTLVIT